VSISQSCGRVCCSSRSEAGRTCKISFYGP